MKLPEPRITLLAAVVAGVAAFATGGTASGPGALTPVPAANPKAVGIVYPNVLSPELDEIARAQGATKVENGTAQVPYYGYDGNGPMVPAPGDVQTTIHNVEATKTEPDKNTYLVLTGQTGADPNYNYGTHFLFQGHEAGAPGYITRINLDADGAHRVTLLATQDDTASALADIDGSTWEPWAQRLLFTTENQNAPTYSATLGVPSQVHDVSGALGRGGYEGIQDDSDGNIWIVEDIGGSSKPATTAKIPNSFVYRYVPANPGDLANGKLQVLQVRSASNLPITQSSQTPLMSPDQVALHTYGNVFNTEWITIHDTAVDGHAPFNANLAAKAANGTPFKRPENGQFRPGSQFKEFYFDETGDTNATSPENACCGGWTSIMKLTQSDPSAATGKLTLFYKGDAAHADFDNTSFLTKDEIVFSEDAGDTLHTQRNALDSAYVFDVTLDYNNPANQPVRILAQGRDASATIDSGIRAISGNGFQNDGDNEITGFHVSDGDPSVNGILGAEIPVPFNESGLWRIFYTQQHGDNVTYKLTRAG